MTRPYVYGRAADLGIPVVDGKDRAFVTVTATDVIKAKEKNSKHCALARAAMRLPKVNAAYFFLKTAYLEYDDKIMRYELPTSVQKEIVSFDRAQIFDPGVYQLSPPPSSRNPKKRKKYDKARNSGRRQVARPKATANERASYAAAVKVAEQTGTTISQAPGRQSTQPVRSALLTEQTKGSALPSSNGVSRRTTGVVGPRAPMPILPSKNYVRRTQYVRDLRDPDQE